MQIKLPRRKQQGQAERDRGQGVGDPCWPVERVMVKNFFRKALSLGVFVPFYVWKWPKKFDKSPDWKLV